MQNHVLNQPIISAPFDLAGSTPLRDRIIVLPLAQASRSKGGIVLAENAHQREKPQEGLVLAVGPGKQVAGFIARHPMDTAVGDVVRFGKYSGQEITIGEVSVLNMAESEVFDRRPASCVRIVKHEKPKDWHVDGVPCDLCEAPANEAAKAALAREREAMLTGAQS